MLIKSYILLEMNLIGSKWTWYFTWTSSQKVPNNFIQFVFFIILLCQPCKIKFPVKLNKTCPSVQTFSFTKFTFMAVVASSFKWVLSVSPWTYHLFTMYNNHMCLCQTDVLSALSVGLWFMLRIWFLAHYGSGISNSWEPIHIRCQKVSPGRLEAPKISNHVKEWIVWFPMDLVFWLRTSSHKVPNNLIHIFSGSRSSLDFFLGINFGSRWIWY